MIPASKHQLGKLGEAITRNFFIRKNYTVFSPDFIALPPKKGAPPLLIECKMKDIKEFVPTGRTEVMRGISVPAKQAERYLQYGSDYGFRTKVIHIDKRVHKETEFLWTFTVRSAWLEDLMILGMYVDENWHNKDGTIRFFDVNGFAEEKVTQDIRKIGCELPMTELLFV